MTSEQKFPPGWDDARVREVLAHYENQAEDEQSAEIEAAQEPTCKMPRLVFPEGFTARDEGEMERKGFVYAFLEGEDGCRYPVMFINPVRLAQDVEATLQSGQPYYYEFGQVVVPEVTVPALTRLIPQLVEEGYLERHVPQREPATNHRGT